MAAPMLGTLRSKRNISFCKLRGFYRTILSDAYRCDQLWKKRLEAPVLQKVQAKLFGIELLDKFDKERQLTAIDVDIFANKVHELDAEDDFITENILYRFRHCDTSLPYMDSIYHALVRAYIDKGQTDSLIQILNDKWKYGVFLDAQASCMLLNHLLDKKDYKGAAQVAYEVMLQEEYEHPIRNLLALCAITKHYVHTMNFERTASPPADEEEDIEYIPVKVIRNPYYDDHFDIKDERLKLGKTMYILGRETANLDPVCSRSLQLIGLGLYEKFELANQQLEQWISEDGVKLVVYEEAIQRYKVYLEDAPIRDPSAPEKSMGEKSIDDEIEILKPTVEEKEAYIAKFKTLMHDLTEDRLSLDTVEQHLDAHVWSEVSKHEADDIKTIKNNYKNWIDERTEKLNEQIRKVTVTTKMDEIHEKLLSLQQQEELLRYFEHETEIRLHHRYRTERKKKEEKTDEEYVEAPGERNVRMKIKRR